ncbi:MAG: efflux RND transporter periplasmic adaptor subunit [Muribaculaceae bacterium]|nr:efflux RND transporter periplasmic adaptor subunit [Muribaculaceae bacterium]
MSTETKKEERSLMISLGIIIAVITLLAIVGFVLVKSPDDFVQGQAEATSIRISGMLPGRVSQLYVTEGDRVSAGDTLVHIHSSLLEAKLMQVQAVEAAAAAQNTKIDNGTRSQIIQSAYQLWQEAIAARDIAQKTFDRMQNLYEENVISAQKRDEAQAAVNVATAAEKAAHSQYELAIAGPQQEDKASATAMKTAAQGSVKEVESILQDQYLTAPCDGEIDEIYPNIGELVATGAPIMSLLKTDDTWVSFNVREEMLNDLPIGKEITIMIPALGKMETQATIFYSKDRGTYAIWRATKPNGEWDSRTFQIKARPITPLPSLRPGMTVIYTPQQ